MAGKAVTPADVSESLLRKRYDPTAALEELLEALDKAPLLSDKPAVKVELDQIIWFSADPVAEEDSKETTPSKAVANGSGVSTPESKETTPSEAVANGSDVKEAAANGVPH